MAALLAAARHPAFAAEIVCVVSNRPGAPGLQRAQEAGIPAAIVDHRAFPDRPAFETQLTGTLRQHAVDIVCNAGFMRLLTPTFVDAWFNRHLNIHPSLLPAFKGLDTHERVLAAGCRVSGCTVHLVREGMDDGPIIGQAAVPVADADTSETLAARVLVAEHALYPRALQHLAGGSLEPDLAAAIDAHAGLQPGHNVMLAPVGQRAP